ncbi:hypothetical protein HDE_11127 [Halotydeus destructor]|nr:hypothetical protein HDE_11127 [Halotydeus destructor]
MSRMALADHQPEAKVGHAVYGSENNFTGPVNQVEPTCPIKMDVICVFHDTVSSASMRRSIIFAKHLSDHFRLSTSRVGFIHYQSGEYFGFSLEMFLEHGIIDKYTDIPAENVSAAIERFNKAEAENREVSGKCFFAGAKVDKAAQQDSVNAITAFALQLGLKDVNDTDPMAPHRSGIYRESLESVENLMGNKCEPRGQRTADSGAPGGGASSSASGYVSSTGFTAAFILAWLYTAGRQARERNI